MPSRRNSTKPIKARPIRGKTESMTARLTPDTKAALVEAADASGRSVGSELELLIREALEARSVTVSVSIAGRRISVSPCAAHWMGDCIGKGLEGLTHPEEVELRYDAEQLQELFYGAGGLSR